jgi:hypothetical protein
MKNTDRVSVKEIFIHNSTGYIRRKCWMKLGYKEKKEEILTRIQSRRERRTYFIISELTQNVTKTTTGKYTRKIVPSPTIKVPAQYEKTSPLH